MRTYFLGSLLAIQALLVPLAHAQALRQLETPKDLIAPPALTEYKGRRIAQTMHYLGA
jgi:hypothetical protein